MVARRSRAENAILVDTEGFVLKAKVHSAKVMDYEGIKTLLRRADGDSLASRICGWTPATEERIRAQTGLRRPWVGAWISSSVRKSPPQKVLMAWAKEWAKEGVAVDWRRLLPP